MCRQVDIAIVHVNVGIPSLRTGTATDSVCVLPPPHATQLLSGVYY